MALIPLSGGERYALGMKVQNQKKKFADRRHKYNPKRKQILEGLGVVFLTESLPAMAQVRTCIALLACQICCPE